MPYKLVIKENILLALNDFVSLYHFSCHVVCKVLASKLQKEYSNDIDRYSHRLPIKQRKKSNYTTIADRLRMDFRSNNSKYIFGIIFPLSSTVWQSNGITFKRLYTT